MKRTHTYVLMTALWLVMMLMFAACGGSGAGTPGPEAPASGGAGGAEKANAPKQMTFKDTAGTEHTLSLPIERAVVINRNTAEALQLLGVQDKVAATGDTTLTNNPYLSYGELPDVGKTGEINLELLISLKPQVVFAYTNRPDRTLEDKLGPAGIPVVRINNYLPGQMEDELRLLGRLFGKEEQAERYLSWKGELEKLLEERVKSIPDEEKKSVLALSAGFLHTNGGYRVFPSRSSDGAPGVGEGYATLLAGGKDAADLQWNSAEASTTVQVDEEYVLSRNPEVITLHGTWLGGYDAADATEHRKVLDTILDMDTIKQLKAGQQKEIYFFHTNVIGSDKRYIGVLQLAKYLYPDRFADIDPDAYLREYFENWLHVPYQGVWHYAAKAD